MEQAVRNDLYRQLEMQDALDGFPYFWAALQPEIRQVVYNKYGVTPPSSPALASTVAYDATYSFSNGGMVIYNGLLNSQAAVLCLIPEIVQEYMNSPHYFKDFVEYLLGYLPPNPLLDLASMQQIILSDMAEQAIIEANYWAKVMFISWGAGTEYAYYAYGWDTYPERTVYDVVEIVTVSWGIPR